MFYSTQCVNIILPYVMILRENLQQSGMLSRRCKLLLKRWYNNCPSGFQDNDQIQVDDEELGNNDVDPKYVATCYCCIICMLKYM